VPEHLALAVVVAVLVGLAAANQWTWTWDQNVYDWRLKLGTRDPPDDLVIAAIDQRSLDALVDWPWSRMVYVRLLDRLRSAGVRTVVLDVIFSEPSAEGPQVDQALAEAVAAHGQVVLPVAHVSVRLGGQPLELMPYPALYAAAAGVGHVETQLDHDGQARSVYLKAGLGEPFWWHLALATLQLEDPKRWQTPPGLTNTEPVSGSPFVWERDHQIWIPFMGPPGRVPSFSVADLLQGVPLDIELRDRIVLVGATATSLGDALPTPVSGDRQPMPGVEIIANVIDGLRQNLQILPLGNPQTVLLSVTLAISPLLVFPYLAPRGVLALTVAATVGVLLLSVLLLWKARLWFPPMAALLGIACSYPIWSWLRLEMLVRHLDDELKRLRSQPRELPGEGSPSLESAMGFVSRLLPLQGAALVSHADHRLAVWRHGNDTAPPPGANAMLRVSDPDAYCELMLRWGGTEPPSAIEHALLRELLRELAPHAAPTVGENSEPVQARVELVREATARLRAMRAFVTDSLAQMADGVLVANVAGRILVGNQNAAHQLGYADASEIWGLPVDEVLAGMSIADSPEWAKALRQALVEGCATQLETTDRSGRETLVHLAPFRGDGAGATGLIVNLADVSALRESERRRVELLGFISHDLRSPLASIVALTQLMALQGAGDERASRIEAHARRTLNLADDLLALARMEGGEGIDDEPVDLVNVVRSTLIQMRDHASTHGAELSSELPAEPLMLHGDERLLERMLMNLVGNALKYSAPDTPVRIHMSGADDQVFLTVEDRGYGISEADIPRLFDRFRRGSSQEHRRECGVGLGLAFVKQVVEQHGGTISVDSQVGEGSRFLLRFPRRV
jgi:PAS domain S-box-containing protein